MKNIDLVKFQVGHCHQTGLLGVSQFLKVKSVRHFMEIIVVARLNPMSLSTKHVNKLREKSNS